MLCRFEPGLGHQFEIHPAHAGFFILSAPFLISANRKEVLLPSGNSPSEQAELLFF